MIADQHGTCSGARRIDHPSDTRRGNEVVREISVAQRDPSDEESLGSESPSFFRTRKFARYFYERFIRLQGSPERIAWGAAVGIIVGMTPAMGFQTFIAVPIAAFFRISKIAAAAGVWLTNPLTAPFIYGLNYMVGAKLLRYPLKTAFLADPSWATLWLSSKTVLLSLTVGGILTGVPTAVAGYFLAFWIVTAAREKARKLKERKEVREKLMERATKNIRPI